MAEQDDATPTVAGRLALAQRAGGLAGPVLTAVFALLIGGLVVLATGANPLSTYRAGREATVKAPRLRQRQ